MDEGDSTASVLLNDIHFIRYHDMRRPVLSNSVDGNVITTDTVRRFISLSFKSAAYCFIHDTA